MLLNLQMPLAIVAHDAGGANQIIAQLQTQHAFLVNIHAYMEGPARKLWLKAFPDIPLCTSAAEALDRSRTLLTGTGWATELEYQAIATAKAANIYTVTLLDHWTNYAQRFIRNDVTVLPDEFWVVDDEALHIANSIFPKHIIKRVPDHYLQAQVAKIAPLQVAAQTLLYVLEPVRSKWGRQIDGEFQALDYLISMLPKIDGLEKVRIMLRLHPSEEKDKYQTWVARYSNISIVFDQSPSLAEAISQAHWVAGCESYALVVAMAAGRTVYCTLPPWAPECRLPHKGLIHIKNLHI
jgi:hypothetical protein